MPWSKDQCSSLESVLRKSRTVNVRIHYAMSLACFTA